MCCTQNCFPSVFPSLQLEKTIVLAATHNKHTNTYQTSEYQNGSVSLFSQYLPIKLVLKHVLEDVVML